MRFRYVQGSGETVLVYEAAELPLVIDQIVSIVEKNPSDELAAHYLKQMMVALHRENQCTYVKEEINHLH